jgi:hypothetical protein
MNKRNKNLENITEKMVEEEIRRGTRREGRIRKEKKRRLKIKQKEE